MLLFRKEADFAAFDSLIEKAYERVPLRILAYTVMGNHWHFVVWPRPGQHEQVSEFFRWLTLTHSQRFHAYHGTSGTGHVYQGRFKSFPIAADKHLLTVLRYVERNPLRAGLVRRAETWRWGSLYRRVQKTVDEQALLTEPPVSLGRAWCQYVNDPQTDAEVEAIRRSIFCGRPFGNDIWRSKVAKQLGLEHTLRSRGRR